MQILIISDMEGATGIVHPEQTLHTSGEFSKAREWLMGDINAAIKGARAAGATSFLVNDGHAFMRNILIDELPPNTSLISGSLKRYVQAEGASKEINGAILVGFHSRMGSIGGVIDHTLVGSVIQDVKINGCYYGEIGINALMCGELGIPVTTVAGDEAAVEEAEELLGKQLETAAVKKGISRYSAECLHPQKAQKLITNAARNGIKKLASKKLKPFRPYKTFDVSIRLTNSAMADMARIIPNVTREDARTVAFSTDSAFKMHDYLNIIIACAKATN